MLTWIFISIVFLVAILILAKVKPVETAKIEADIKSDAKKIEDKIKEL